MATALVVRAQRYKKIGDKTSPLVYILKRKPLPGGDRGNHSGPSEPLCIRGFVATGGRSIIGSILQGTELYSSALSRLSDCKRTTSAHLSYQRHDVCGNRLCGRLSGQH